MLLQFDGTFILIAISFVFFMLLMQAVFYGPMTKVRQERQSYIDGKNQAASASLEESESLKNKHESTVTKARIAASKEISNSTLEANKEKSDALDNITQEVNKKINTAREELEKDKAKAKSVLQSDVLSLAQMISGKVLGHDIPISDITDDKFDNILNR